MLFAFDMVSGERETGTLRQTISNSVKRPILIVGKWIGGFTSFVVPFFIAVLLGTILVTLSPMVDINAQNWAKLGLFLFSSVLYLAVFFSLGLLISCLTHQSSSSLVISLFFWAMLVFFIPNLGNILARQFVEIPTVQQLEVKRSQIWIKEVFERINREKNVREVVGSINSENDKLIADYRNRFDRLVTVSQNITRFSPAAAFTCLATDLMGTGISEERRLKKAVLLYKDLVWNKQQDDLPTFNFHRSSSIKEVFGFGGLANLMILILFNMLFFVSAYVAFLRYDVR
jgi:ABC-type transport system involved in multi-copper enzyme maturation permease subunit